MTGQWTEEDHAKWEEIRDRRAQQDSEPAVEVAPNPVAPPFSRIRVEPRAEPHFSTPDEIADAVVEALGNFPREMDEDDLRDVLRRAAQAGRVSGLEEAEYVTRHSRNEHHAYNRLRARAAEALAELAHPKER